MTGGVQFSAAAGAWGPGSGAGGGSVSPGEVIVAGVVKRRAGGCLIAGTASSSVRAHRHRRPTARSDRPTAASEPPARRRYPLPMPDAPEPIEVSEALEVTPELVTA